MKLEYVAIITSALSALVAVFALGWNVYRDVLLRPRIRVRYHIRRIAGGLKDGQDIVFLSATNMGPSRVRLTMIHFRNTTLWGKITRKFNHGIIMHDWTDPTAWQLPC
jgi:hypothetical protein